MPSSLLNNLCYDNQSHSHFLHLRLRFPILVIRYAYKVDDLVGATELIIKFEQKAAER